MSRFCADMELDCEVTLFTNPDQGDRGFHVWNDPRNDPPTFIHDGG